MPTVFVEPNPLLARSVLEDTILPYSSPNSGLPPFDFAFLFSNPDDILDPESRFNSDFGFTSGGINAIGSFRGATFYSFGELFVDLQLTEQLFRLGPDGFELATFGANITAGAPIFEASTSNEVPEPASVLLLSLALGLLGLKRLANH